MRSKRMVLFAVTLGVMVAWSHAVPLPTDKAASETSAEGDTDAHPPSENTPCGSCYGADDIQKGIRCCDSCEDVRNAYKTKGWAWPGET